MHSIRTDFGFNLLHSASKLKRGVIEKKMVGAFGFPYFPSPNIFFFFAVNRESFSVKYFTFFMIYASRLRFCENNFQCDLLCLFFVFIFSQPDVNIT